MTPPASFGKEQCSRDTTRQLSTPAYALQGYVWSCMSKPDEKVADLVIGVLQSVAISIQSACAASYHTML